MAIDFPNTPALGQVFQAGYSSWVWDGVKWGPAGLSTGYLPLSGGNLTGNLGVGIPVPAGQAPANVAQGGGWTFGWGFTAPNWWSNLYYDGSNTRYLTAGTGWVIQQAGNIWSVQSAPSGAKDAVATPETVFHIDTNANVALGGLNVPPDTNASSVLYAGIFEAGAHVINIYGSSAPSGWSYFQNGIGAYFGSYANGMQLLVAVPGTAGASVPNWGGTFLFGDDGSFNVSGSATINGGLTTNTITANTSIWSSGTISCNGNFATNGGINGGSTIATPGVVQCGNLDVTNSAGQYYVYPSGTSQIFQYLANWYDSFNYSGGVREWIGAGISLMSLDGGGNFSANGNITSNNQVYGNTVVGNVVTGNAVNSNNTIYAAGTLSTNSTFTANGAANLNSTLYVAQGLTLGGGSLGIQYTRWASNWVAFDWQANALRIKIDDIDNGAIQTVSDERIKENIADADEDTLALLKDIQIKKFDMPLRHTETKEGAPHYEAGFIAQQLRTVSPDMVIVGRNEEDLMSVDLLPMLARCVRAIQQLTARIEVLEAAGAH